MRSAVCIGDAFAAGCLNGLLFGLDQTACLRRGYLSAASTLTVSGNRGPLPGPGLMSALLGCPDGRWVRVAAGQVVAPLEGGPGP